MTAQTETTTREQIRALLTDRAAAITAKDARRAVDHCAPDIVSFGLASRSSRWAVTSRSAMASPT
jgi:ketosteroid isomerase-like protein